MARLTRLPLRMRSRAPRGQGPTARRPGTLVPALGAVRAHLGAADIEFTPDDETVAIVESWPRVLSGAAAAADWGWQPRFLLDDAASDFVGRVRQIGDGAQGGDGRPEVAESR
jgi:hypothetical protein